MHQSTDLSRSKRGKDKIQLLAIGVGMDETVGWSE